MRQVRYVLNGDLDSSPQFEGNLSWARERDRYRAHAALSRSGLRAVSHLDYFYLGRWDVLLCVHSLSCVDVLCGLDAELKPTYLAFAYSSSLPSENWSLGRSKVLLRVDRVPPVYVREKLYTNIFIHHILTSFHKI